MRAKQILIADDDRQLVEALRLHCRALGLEVRTTHDGVSTLNAIHAQPPDVVCLDVNMPQGNGLSICELLAADANWKSIPMIVLTGRIDESTIRRCHDVCAYYVLKCGNVWPRIEPLLHELLAIDLPSA
jgi:CheY-like chemotaxis protein